MPGVALSRNLPRKAAFEMLVTGDFISAEEARVKGLVNRVAAPEALDDEVEALVARIVAKPRVGGVLGKALFYRQSTRASCPPTRTPARRWPAT